ncbi:glycosyltransferase family 22 protein [Aplosporella prunicola CBS 121167]|uniref:Mannosyltransferase n=1 Tax=Aplosporella prunicola CBS 121167 TaxID=1176127 RepID=A0A6A6BVC0_9PEZI|nr:glycosyltransferase family 22 protein [Aplosporella prunicola CBS 121167]KAF2147215.1 glycosyltransferase family 22 protein [Aplosporella prunicola CBS 121167]
MSVSPTHGPSSLSSLNTPFPAHPRCRPPSTHSQPRCRQNPSSACFHLFRASKLTPIARPPPPQFNPAVAFYIFFATHLLAALFAPIQDCDEIYNYFEPTHYLNHGHGLQTWEYSPEYAIRSWAYAGIHAAVTAVGRLLPNSTKVTQFYLLRIALAFVCTCCETRLCSTIARTLNHRIAIFFLVAMVFSPGMFHASAAYLPSSFTMYTNMLGLSAFMDWRGGLRTAQGIFWFAVGGILGWPFATVMVLPFILEEVVLASVTNETWQTFRRFLDGAMRSLVVLVLEVCIDSFFYKKLVCVPLNIVLYNVFSGPGKGPDIYGTESWHFYIRNLLLNFNVWFVLALGALPLSLAQHFLRRQSATKQSILRGLVFVSPFYLWMTIFTLQPHKEERFMYPAYPFLALNSAISLHIVLAYVGSMDPRDLVSKIPAKLKLAVVSICIMGAIDLGVWRALGMTTAYSAPLKVYAPLQEPGVARAGDNVCLGKEWYRFPSSYFLPGGVRAKFVKSAFTGLLPGEFSEASSGFGFFPGAWLTPSGMNDENKEDPSKYTDIDHCSFVVDSSFSSMTATELEPDYLSDTETWEALRCEKFLDPTQTGTLGRLVWIPDWSFIPEQHRRKWGQYCLLRRKSINPLARTCMASRHLNESNRREQKNPNLSTQRCVKITKPHSGRSSGNNCCYRHCKYSFQHVDNMKLRLSDLCDTEKAKAASRYIQEHTLNKPVLYSILIAATVVWLFVLLLRQIKAKKQPARARSPDLEKPSKGNERNPGEWVPQDWKRPTATPYPDWSVTKTKPLPYRPFRYGPKYNTTMGLRAMDWDGWIELDNHYMKYHDLKAKRLAERGSKCYHTAPEAFDGAVELLEELCDYLPQRYPSLFRKTDVGMNNLATGESLNIVERPLKEDPMAMSARQIQDDLAIMFEKPDGQYYLLAGAILLAGFWRLQDKLGMPLSEIHTSGNVPGFKEKLEKGMMNFFKRVKPESPVLRNNYFIQVDDDLAWSHSIGNEDGEEGTLGWFSAEKDKAIQHHWFRSERQSLRRLPRSGGVVFTIRTYFHPITDICQEPYVPGRLASAIRSWGDDVSRYKGKERYEKVLLEYLDKKHQEQIADGLDLSKEDEVRNYPY